MKTFIASVRVVGFVEVEVQARNRALAATAAMESSLEGRQVSAVVFDGLEGPPVEKIELIAGKTHTPRKENAC